ncbi:MAG: AraC family transcriptional regulator, partial [Arenicellales bacterium]|nr:AraC family transcriptional regulator [Arenicellales bacterium]
MAQAKQLANSDYARAAKAVAFLRTHSHDRPTLAQAAAAVGLSPSHFQKLFKRWVGISPKKYLQSLALTEAQRQLRDGQSVLDSAFNAGLSGPGRLHDLFVTFQGMTPAEYRDRGSGLSIG